MSSIRLPLAVVAAAMFVLQVFSGGNALAQDAALDTTKIPRIANAKELFAFPQSTAYTTALSVPEALTAVSGSLAGEGWQAYVPAFSSQVSNPQLAIAQFKKDRQILSVMINIAPAQNNATSVSYTALVNAHDLPFPKDASATKYDPERPYLACSSQELPEALSAQMRGELKARGWSPWSPQASARAETADEKTSNGVSSYYVSDNHPPLHLSLIAADGKTQVVIEAISPEVLAKASQMAAGSKAEPAPEAPATSRHDEEASEARKAADDAFDSLSKDIMDGAKKAIAEALDGAGKPRASDVAADSGKVLKALDASAAGPSVPLSLPEGSEDINFSDGKLEFTNEASVAQIAAFHRDAMKSLGWTSVKTPINKANMAVLEFKKAGKDVSMTIMRMGDHTMVTATGSALAQEEASEGNSAANAEGDAVEPALTADKLEPEETNGLIVPQQHTMAGNERTLFRMSANATVPAGVDEVLKFYRRELGKKADWKQEAEKITSGRSAEVRFTTAQGPAVLTLKQANNATEVLLTLRNTEEAKKSGLLPKPGQVRFILGSVVEKDATLSIGKKTVKVAAGVGSKAPDGPSLELAPGKYKCAAKGPGVSGAAEEVTVGPDEIWGLMIGPGGILAIQAY